MADIPSVQSDLSIGQRQLTPNESVVPTAAFAASTRPVDLIRAQQRNDQQITRLQYPSDVPKYYLLMDIQSYSRSDLFTIAKTDTLSTIVLPIPEKLVDTQQTKYEQGKFANPGIAGGINAAAPGIRDAINNANGAIGTVTGVGGAIATANTAKAVGAGALAGLLDREGGDVTQGIKAFTGYAPNYFLTVLLDGPQYKIHNLTWKFSPRSPAESETLNRIIRVMNNAMAPGTAFGGVVFTFPRVFRLAYRPNPRYLYKFKPAVLINFTVDYSGGGVPSFYRTDGQTNGKNPPVMLTMQATFMELEFWLRSDFGGDKEGGGDAAYIDSVDSTQGSGRGSN